MSNLNVVCKTDLKYLTSDEDYKLTKEDLKKAAGHSISAIDTGLKLIAMSHDLTRDQVNNYIGEITTRLMELRHTLLEIHNINVEMMKDLD